MKYSLSSIEELYLIYPLKKGKKKGQEKLLKMLNSDVITFDQAKAAVVFYKDEWLSEGTLPKYTPHWATFINQQIEDYIEKSKISDKATSSLQGLLKAWESKDKKKLDELGVNYE